MLPSCDICNEFLTALLGLLITTDFLKMEADHDNTILQQMECPIHSELPQIFA
jgi:hypothetical protein